MTKDTKSTVQNKRSSKRIEEKNHKKKMVEDSSDDDDSYCSTDTEEEMDVHEYRKFLSKLFPSKHLNNKIKSGEKVKEILNKKIEKQDVSEEDTEDDEEYDTEEDEDDEYDDDSDFIVQSKNKKYKSNGKSNKFNIIFTIGNVKDEEDDDEYYEDDIWETEDDDEYDSVDTENEDESVSSDEDSDNDCEKEEEDEEEVKNKKQKNSKKAEKEKEKTKDDKVKNKKENKENKEKITSLNENQELLKVLKGMEEKNGNDDMLAACIKVCENKIKNKKVKNEKKTKKQKDKNERIFKKILSDKNTMNDFTFFNKLEIHEQVKIIKELREINSITRIEKPYRLTLLESPIPTIFKAAAMKKISSLRYMEPGSGEFYKIKNWVDTFMRIPFEKYENLPITIEDGVDKCHEFMDNAKKTLDSVVYGLNDAKMQIMQMLGQLITNPKAIGTAIAIQGPMGTGKTTLVKEGISKILNRPFAFIALGGATDSSFLEGHSYTYEGSMWGKIVQILIDSKCMNPVIYFDELDKISDTPKGEEIAGILTHLTDTSQNNQFHDKYFSEIDFDLSKCLFIFSYNDESKVNPILRDRMYRIQTKGYERKQKIVISNNHLLPKIREQIKFDEKDIIIPDDTIQYIIDNQCSNEDGVRNLKRCLEIIHTKLNLYRLMKPGSNLFEEEMTINVTFPFTVTRDIVNKLIKRKDDNHSFKSLYV